MSKRQVLAVWCSRLSSERFTGKALAPIAGEPCFNRIFARLKQSRHIRRVVLAIPTGTQQDELARVATALDIPVSLGPEHDVVARMDLAVQRHAEPDDYILRVLGDQPTFDAELFDRHAAIVIGRKWDFAWPLAFGQDPVYGASNYPWSRRAWAAIAAHSRGEEREHPGMWLRRSGHSFVYGLIDLPHWAYRPYRLELDTSADLAMLSGLWDGAKTASGKAEPSLRDMITYLDRNPTVAGMNAQVHEKTGTYTSFTKAEIAEWERDFAGREIVWADGGLSGVMAGGRGERQFRCRECGGLCVAQGITKRNDLSTRCLQCGEERLFYSEKPR